ncbi:MAG TPA: universal stress protein [Bradyrhizobium sp.]|nr:universal stress protein [Bradyrhizobium sp.]
MKSILVPIGGSGSDEALLETALAAARPVAAHLHFLHIRIGVGQAAQYTPHVSFASGPALQDALEDLDTQSRSRSTKAFQHVHEFCARMGVTVCEGPARAKTVTASCQVEEGDAVERLIFHARHNDLIVVSRPTKPNGLPPDFLELLIMRSGRPVLIASASPVTTVADTIMVCWRESADAARALTAAAPLLDHAKRLVFVGVAENGTATQAALNEIMCGFAWSGTAAEMQIIPPNGRPVQELLARAARVCGADLIIAGAYGHSRLAEAVFGGCTQSFIRHCDRPVLLMH